MIPGAPAALQSDACACGADWAATTTTIGTVVMLCGACGARELVIAHHPAPPLTERPRRTPLTLSNAEVQAIATRIGSGISTLTEESRRFGGATEENALRQRLRTVLGKNDYEQLMAGRVRRCWGGRHLTRSREHVDSHH